MDEEVETYTETKADDEEGNGEVTHNVGHAELSRRMREIARDDGGPERDC